MRALLAVLAVVLVALPAAAEPMSVYYDSASEACLAAGAAPLPVDDLCTVAQHGGVHLGGCIPTECILHLDVDVSGSGPPGDHLVRFEVQWDDETPGTLCEFNAQVLRDGLGCIVFVWFVVPVAADECTVMTLRGTYEANLALVAQTVDRMKLCRDASGDATLRPLR